MGEVYRADDLKLGVPVALKFLPPKHANDKTWLERMHNEVRVARDVAHPKVCRMYDIAEADGEHPRAPSGKRPYTRSLQTVHQPFQAGDESASELATAA